MNNETRTASPHAPDPGETAHRFLRRVTRPWHDAVEGAFARFDLATHDGLKGFLVRQAMAVIPLERALDRAGAGARFADWPTRRRSGALTDDLLRLGTDLPPQGVPPEITTPFHLLGILYVLEGSKLGGRVLHRRVLGSADPRVRGAGAFLGHRDGSGWPGFLAVLDAVRPEPAAWAGLYEGARSAFARFADAAAADDEPSFARTPTFPVTCHEAHA